MSAHAPIVPVLLSGGSGTRLWPMSRVRAPKQMQRLIGNRTMIQETALRVAGKPGFAAPIVVCNEAHAPLVAYQLKQVGVHNARLITEPIGRNTAPAIAAAALEVCESGMDDATLLVLPADHAIQKPAAFLDAIATARIAADKGYLVTFGIVPTAPNTGYGYIKAGRAMDLADGLFVLDAFVEKPDRERAEAYLKSGDYSWNSGMFLFRADRYLSELQAHAPDALKGAKAAFKAAKIEGSVRALARAEFAEAEAISIDYAVMECTRLGAVVPADLGWSDVGAFDALWALADHDKADNAVTDGTDAVLIDSRGLYVQGGERVIAAIGVKDLVIVDTPDALLVADRAQIGRAKEVALALAEEGRPEAFEHTAVETPEGTMRLLRDMGENGSVHLFEITAPLDLAPIEAEGLIENWTVLSGQAHLQCSSGQHHLATGDQLQTRPQEKRAVTPLAGETFTALVSRVFK